MFWKTFKLLLGPLHVIDNTTNLHQIVGVVSWGDGCVSVDYKFRKNVAINFRHNFISRPRRIIPEFMLESIDMERGFVRTHWIRVGVHSRYPANSYLFLLLKLDMSLLISNLLQEINCLTKKQTVLLDENFFSTQLWGFVFLHLNFLHRHHINFPTKTKCMSSLKNPFHLRN